MDVISSAAAVEMPIRPERSTLDGFWRPSRQSIDFLPGRKNDVTFNGMLSCRYYVPSSITDSNFFHQRRNERRRCQWDLIWFLLYVQARACPARVKAHEREFLIYFIFFFFPLAALYSSLSLLIVQLLLFLEFVSISFCVTICWSTPLVKLILIFLLRSNEFTHIMWMNELNFEFPADAAAVGQAGESAGLFDG